MERQQPTLGGDLLAVIAKAGPISRAALLDASGLSRATVTQRLNALISMGLLVEADETRRSGGRPSRLVCLNADAASLLAANIGESHIRLSVMSLQLAVLAQVTIAFDIEDGPSGTLDAVSAAFAGLMKQVGRSDSHVAGIGLSLPTPVDFRRGRVVGPSVLHGWDEFDIVSYLARSWDAPVWVENDVNLMALFEYTQSFQDTSDMFFIKAGTGIGSGIVSGGRIFRGAQGAAGDIGHIQITSKEEAPLCRCGKFGCIEARAAGWAIARDLAEFGHPAQTARDVVALVEAGVPEAIMLLRSSGRTIGEVVADVVSILNPARIVVGGTLARCGEHLLSGIRELVYQRCLPLATRELEIIQATTSTDSALVGAAMLVRDQIFSPKYVDRFIRRFLDRPEFATDRGSLEG
ncbi:MAG: sugar kinase [Proteobacteria bacterium]|nr:sugar kinase [Pseudomonadota bacterium]